MKRILATATAVICVLAATAALGQAAPAAAPTGLDARALQSIAEGNLKTAAALEISGAIGAISNSQDCASVDLPQRGMCIVMAKAFGLVAYMAGNQVRAVAQAPAPPPQIINAAPPPTVGERIVGMFVSGINKIFDVGMALGPAYMNMRSTNHVSDNTTRANIAAGANALAATVSTNQAFVAMNQGTVALGQTGFRTGARTAAEAFAASTAQAQAYAQALGKPSSVINVNGDCNAVSTGAGTATTGCNRTEETTTITTDNSDRSVRTGTP